MSNAFNYRLNSLYNEFSRRAAFLVVHSNINESMAEVRGHAQSMGYDFPVYRDIENHAANLLGAQVTPSAFVIDPAGVIQYRGYIEDAPNPERARNPGLRLAIEAVLAGRPVAEPETHGRGCAIRRAIAAGN